MLLIERGKRKAMPVAFLPVLCKEFLGLLLTQEWALLISCLFTFVQSLLQDIQGFPRRLPEKLVCTLLEVEVINTAVGITTGTGGIILNGGNAHCLRLHGLDKSFAGLRGNVPLSS